MTLKTYSIASVASVQADDCIKGVFINPVLADDFDCTANEDRPFEHMIWWMRPYIVGRAGEGGDNSNGDWTLRCLDGGAWDRSTYLGRYNDLEDAIQAAHDYTLRQPYIGLMKSLGGTPGAYSVSPVEWWKP